MANTYVLVFLVVSFLLAFLTISLLSIHATFPAHHYKARSSSLCSFLHPPVASSPSVHEPPCSPPPSHCRTLDINRGCGQAEDADTNTFVSFSCREAAPGEITYDTQVEKLAALLLGPLSEADGTSDFWGRNKMA
jgi:hypothetical protein